MLLLDEYMDIKYIYINLFMHIHYELRLTTQFSFIKIKVLD